MDPWWKVVQPRREIREGRSFNPAEFAIHLEQVVAGTAPQDYLKPGQFFSRTCFTRALREHSGMVLKRLAGQTANTAPVLTLVTQFGGGKTHTLTALYHMARHGEDALDFEGVPEVLVEAGLQSIPKCKVGVFVGNSWDPEPGKETPWIDLARQLAGDSGVAALGIEAKTTPPGTTALCRVFEAAGAPVLLLFDEVLNFVNRHRNMADAFHAFVQNLTVAITGTTNGAAVISLPRSQVEMTDWDMQWQDRITKIVRRVAKDLIANDESEISEVMRRRLFEDLGDEKIRHRVAEEFAQWTFERRAQLPPEWTAVDATATDKRSQALLQSRFEACYPFHPATLSVFQRKWQALPQYQQTRGTLAMLAQWISWAYRDGFRTARREPLITLGSAPLHVPEFRGVMLGQLGEPRLAAAIDADIAGEQAHARALDADTRDMLEGIHQRVGTTIFFESSGGQVDKVAHLPELRFALGEPDVDTTSIDNAAAALEDRSFFIRRVGADGFRILHQPTLKKVVADRRASLDSNKETKPTMRQVTEKEFKNMATMPVVPFPADSVAVPDSPELTLVVMDPEIEWTDSGSIREQTANWTKLRGGSPRLYPGSIIWVFRKPGRDLRDRIEAWLAWQRVAKEISEGVLGVDFGQAERQEIRDKLSAAQEDARDEVWATYRFVVLWDAEGEDSLRVIDLSAGHSSGSETLCGRIVRALKSEGLLNESVGAGYLQRNWPPAFEHSGAWPLSSLRQAFLDGTLTRLPDAEMILRRQIVSFIERGEFALASGSDATKGYQRIWYGESLPPEEVSFESGVFLLTQERAEAIGGGATDAASEDTDEEAVLIGGITEETDTEVEKPKPEEKETARTTTVKLAGPVPSELWNRFGNHVLTKLRSQGDLDIQVTLTVSVRSESSESFVSDLQQALQDLGVEDDMRIERG